MATIYHYPLNQRILLAFPPGRKGCSIPDGVTDIGDAAFFRCSSLSTLKLPASVTGIGKWAFFDCSSLALLELPANVISIEDFALEDCSQLTLKVHKDSYAEEYAKENEIKYQTF